LRSTIVDTENQHNGDSRPAEMAMACPLRDLYTQGRRDSRSTQFSDISLWIGIRGGGRYFSIQPRSAQWEDTMNAATGIRDTKSLIIHELTTHGPCSLEALAKRMRSCTWNQLFSAMDELSRERHINLQPHTRFDYMISLSASQPAAAYPEMANCQPDMKGTTT
jgi:hypothetical protein